MRNLQVNQNSVDYMYGWLLNEKVLTKTQLEDVLQLKSIIQNSFNVSLSSGELLYFWNWYSINANVPEDQMKAWMPLPDVEKIKEIFQMYNDSWYSECSVEDYEKILNGEVEE